ncbi:hypothetical protein P5P81_13555 [Tritonibacter mobilis]|nr:hypothetical protein [Tritonibacter mobilis]
MKKQILIASLLTLTTALAGGRFWPSKALARAMKSPRLNSWTPMAMAR